jgi:prepilin-type processing-associated H-X9-DG protein
LGYGATVTSPATAPDGFDRLIGFMGSAYSPVSTGGLLGVSNPDLSTLAAGCTTWYGNRCRQWIVGKTATSTFCAYHKPNDSVPDLNSMGVGFYAARSMHPQGVNVAYADGSVHFILNDINVNVWRGLATRAGNECEQNF